MKTSQIPMRCQVMASTLLVSALCALVLPARAATDLPGALDAPSLSWTTGGNANWQGQGSVSKDGVDSAQSGVIPSSSESWIETTVIGPGTLTYWWKVSSESGYDYLAFYIDGTRQSGEISGEVDWQEQNFTINAGVHTIRWSYSKDGSAIDGADAGWVDQVTFTPDGPVTTKSATNITATGATLNGTVNPGGLATTALFEFGTTNSYGSTINVTLSPENGTVPQDISASINGLQEATVYHYRIVATNSGGPVTGTDKTFTTLSPFQYTKTNGEVTITGYTGPDKELIIPSLIEGLPVTKIGDRAFDYQSITSVTIPSGVTSIGSEAFYACSGLVTVSLPNTLTSIGSYTFSGCYALLTMTLPNSVTTLDSGIFQYCESLTSVTLPSGITSIPNSMFYGCSSLTAIGIPAAVTSIGSSAFRSCGSLTSATLPNGLTALGDNAFASCGTLTSISLPGTLTSIGSSAFQYCYSLTGMTLPNSVTSLGSGIFSNCTELTGVTFPSGIAAIPSSTFQNCGKLAAFTIPSGVTTIGSAAFSRCSVLAAITLPSGLSSIGDEAFRNCAALTGMTVPNSVTSLGYGVFAGCSGLTSAILPSGLSSIPSESFYGCNKLTGLLIPNGVTSIGSYAFADCSNLASLSIPSGVTSIGDRAFSACAKLASLIIPNAVTNFGSELFSNCTGLVSVTLPSGLTSIGYSSFANCTSLTGLLIPSGVTSIATSAFQACSSLTSLTLPAGLTSIGSSAFSSCSNLTSITIPNSVTNFGSGMFSGCGKLASVTLPSGITTIPGYTFANCSSLVNVAIPLGVTSIGYAAFSGCVSLTGIALPAAVVTIESNSFENCTSLASFVVDPANTIFSSASGALLNKSKTILIRCPEGLAGAYSIPGTVTQVRDSAFARCLKLTGVTIPSSVQDIGDTAFSGCASLTSISIPGNVKDIGFSAFSNCPKLGSVSILPGVLNIGDSAFYGCTSLTSISIPGSVKDIGSSAFYDCTKLGSASILSGVLKIGSSAFYGCTSLTSISIPGTVTSIGSSAFSNCAKLGSITIPSSVKSLGSSVFAGCSTLASAALPASIGTIPSSAFSGCVKLAALAIPSGITSLGSSAFYDCASLANITLPASLTNIGSYAFFRCRSLQTINVPAAVSSIGYRSFAGCTNLASISVDPLNQSYSSLAGVLFDKTRTLLIKMPETAAGNYTIPNGVTEVEDSAFDNCVLITGLTIPSTVTVIGSYAFRYCRSLTAISIPSSVTEIGRAAFLHCRSMATLILDGEIGVINEQTFANCTSLKSVTIPESVYYIGELAFSGAINLERAWFLGDAPTVDEDVFYPAASNFRIHFLIGAQDFTSPTWMGYPTTGLSTFAIPEIDVQQGTSLTDGTGTLNFGNSTIGSAGVLKTFTIRNEGTGTLTGISVSKLGTDAAQFIVGTPGVSSLAPGASTSFSVTLKASSLGAKSATLRIASNDADENPFDIALSGLGVGPEIAVAMGADLADGKSSVAFGNATIGSAGVLKTFTVRNNGNANLTGLAVSTLGTDASQFIVGALGASSLAPGASTTFTVTLKATTLNAKSATLRIANNDADENPFDIALAGTGVGPEIAVSMGSDLTDGKSTVAFGNVKTSSAGIVKTFTIKNIGNANLTGLAVSKSGAHAANFTVGALGAATVLPGRSTTFKVTFKPSATGPRTATIKIVSNDANENPFDIKLTGGGLAAASKSNRLASLVGVSSASTGSQSRTSSAGMMTIDGKRFLCFTYQETADSSSVKKTVEVSPNLIDWFSGSNHTTVVSRAGGIVKVRDNLPITPGNKRFIRLREHGN